MSIVNSLLAGVYEGEYKNGRFHGQGTYKYMDACYEGSFHNGDFQGHGTLTVKGGYFEGYWQGGKLMDGGFVFDDKLHYKRVDQTVWDYVSKHDPRFYSEILKGVPVEGPLTDISAHSLDHFLPKDCYDCIDGYYDSWKHAVMSYETKEILRTPNQAEIDFILANFRVGKKKSE